MAAVVDTRLERYAELAVRVGANVREGQTLFVTREHRARAARTRIWRGRRTPPARATSTCATADPHIRRAMIEHGPDEALTHTPDWLKTRMCAHRRRRLRRHHG